MEPPFSHKLIKNASTCRIILTENWQNSYTTQVTRKMSTLPGKMEKRHQIGTCDPVRGMKRRSARADPHPEEPADQVTVCESLSWGLLQRRQAPGKTTRIDKRDREVWTAFARSMWIPSCK